jgi:signal transduction histidine kinase
MTQVNPYPAANIESKNLEIAGSLVMPIHSHDKDVLLSRLRTSEDRLIELVLYYAEQHNYTKYTSTLKEAWRLSIEKLSQSIVDMLTRSDQIPELGPDEVFHTDPGAQFGVLEAKRHRARGVSLSMFLGLMKYYRQAYIDLLEECSEFDKPNEITLLINRFFDRIELAYCDEWAGSSQEAQIKELSDSNLHLANEKNKYLTLFESLCSPVILCDEHGRVDNYNDAAGRLLLGSNTPGSRYYAEQRNDLVPPALEHELAQVMTENREQLTVEKIYQTPDGERIYDVQIEQMLDVSHKFTGYTLLFSDITERLSWANKLQKVNQKQKQLIGDLNQTREQLVQSEKLAAVGQLASGIAHEINTPIQYIGHNIHFLQDAIKELQRAITVLEQLLVTLENGQTTPQLVAEVRNQLDELEPGYLFDEFPNAINQSLQGVERISTIVSALKFFSGPGSQEKTETDINAAIMSTVHVSTNEWKSHAEITTELDPGLPPIDCVAGEVNQALLNIIINAAEAITDKVLNNRSVEKGKITIRTRQEGGWVVIEVKDTGPGIPDEIKSKVFDPFFTTKEVGKGIGQGLNVVYNTIVTQHRGKIDLQTKLGEGTTFEMRLPVKSLH